MGQRSGAYHHTRKIKVSWTTAVHRQMVFPWRVRKHHCQQVLHFGVWLDLEIMTALVLRKRK